MEFGACSLERAEREAARTRARQWASVETAYDQAAGEETNKHWRPTGAAPKEF